MIEGNDERKAKEMAIIRERDKMRGKLSRRQSAKKKIIETYKNNIRIMRKIIKRE